MTYEEAKDHLICGRINCLTDMDKDEELRYVCLKALEKQIAKKPWSQADDDTCLYYHNECPCCGRWLSERIKPHHCVCGQAIDWSEVE